MIGKVIIMEFGAKELLHAKVFSFPSL